MRGVCISTQLTEKQRIDAGVNVTMNSNYNMTVGREYLVIGLSFIKGSDVYGTTVLFEVEDDSGLWEIRYIPDQLLSQQIGQGSPPSADCRARKTRRAP